MKFCGGFVTGIALGCLLWWTCFAPAHDASVLAQSAAARPLPPFDYAPLLHPLLVVLLELLAVALACWEADVLLSVAE